MVSNSFGPVRPVVHLVTCHLVVNIKPFPRWMFCVQKGNETVHAGHVPVF